MIVGLNSWLVLQAVAPQGALADAGAGRFVITALALLCSALLAWIANLPLRTLPPVR